MVFAPTMPWKSPFITPWADFRSRNLPTVFAEQGQFITTQGLLIEQNEKWKLDHERLFIVKPPARYVCNRCGIVAVYSVRHRCPRKECEGILEQRPFDAHRENIIARWVAGESTLRF